MPTSRSRVFIGLSGAAVVAATCGIAVTWDGAVADQVSLTSHSSQVAGAGRTTGPTSTSRHGGDSHSGGSNGNRSGRRHSWGTTPTATSTTSTAPTSEPTSTASTSATSTTVTSTTASAPSTTASAPSTTTTTSSATTTAGTTTTSAAAGSYWHPGLGLTWDLQYAGTVDTSRAVDVFDLDGEDTSATTVSTLHAKRRKVICYVDAGSYEDFRSDASAFPASILGSSNGWPGEKWLDIRNWTVLEPILSKRFDQCVQKGFDAVDPDNVDGYSNKTGFPLTAADQLTFNKRLAELAHAKGLAVGLKNDLEQVAALEPSFDFAVNEQCHEYGECDLLTPFVKAGKAVFNVEYDETTSQFCATSKQLGLSSIRKNLSLDAYREAC